MGMPLFAEQPDNIARAIDRGFALSVSVKKLSSLAKDLEQALRRVLTEPSFAANGARVSKLMRAHRETPAEVAASKCVGLGALTAVSMQVICHHLHGPLFGLLCWFVVVCVVGIVWAVQMSCLPPATFQGLHAALSDVLQHICCVQLWLTFDYSGALFLVICSFTNVPACLNGSCIYDQVLRSTT